MIVNIAQPGIFSRNLQQSAMQITESAILNNTMPDKLYIII